VFRIAYDRFDDACFRGDELIVVDATTTRRSEFNEWNSIADQWGHTVILVKLPVDLSIAKQRNAIRESMGERFVPVEVLQRQYDNLSAFEYDGLNVVEYTGNPLVLRFRVLKTVAKALFQKLTV
jgi:predicted kinase